MLFQIKSYLNFLWHSTNEHGVHSPFVFNLLTKCFYDKKPKPEYQILTNYRKSLLENKNFIEVTDFGAGSKVFKSNKRQISKIASTAGISPKRAELLFRVTNYFKPQNILEIGTSLGLASSALTLGSKESFLLSLEGCQNTQSVAENLFNKQFPDFNFDFVNSEFSKFLHEGSANICSWDLIYFDGNHSKKATLEYFNLLLPTINNDSIWIFDDIHWSPEMEEAWEIIKNHSKVKVTIDTFQWGFVFFRYEQEKEHFVIRA
ncbi:class I SAM-dependent methyltransferase [Flavobacterium sp. KACC 22758]|jgi:predicted O-methyltransferase YrrM|uniref:class I SAM-dependent methyltransferase n=1 Tax=Flavobacterium sp. KACC 22758 TaxID=3025667 RepID=UPI0023662F09|nr:class I SAM-dependent methyltransferase [Flavobacterium sp. KACC 22758]WDF58741.1 class I SAM-dependent methyltransferase [Flavobacterium sp. KACC 22758]